MEGSPTCLEERLTGMWDNLFKRGDIHEMSVKFIEDEADILAFFPETLRFFNVNQITKSLIEKVDNGIPYQELNMDNVTEEEYNTIKKIVEECSRNIPLEEKYGERQLAKFILNITNKCNLRCEYCYANGGNYQSEEGIMSEQVAKQALDRFFEEYDYIRVIQIFGGEPTMNLPLIRFICEYVRKKNEGLDRKIDVGIVTNGTLFTDEFISIVKEYKLFVTVSYDGHPKVNDKMRKYKGGKGTSDIILKNMKKLKEETGCLGMIEVTYNQHHVEEGIHIMDIINFIHEQLGNVPLHIVPTAGSNDLDYILNDREEFAKAVDEIFAVKKEGKEINDYLFLLVERILQDFMTKKCSKYICEAGTKAYAVSTKGNVYPCFIMTDEEEHVMGNVFDEDLFTSEQFQRIREKYERFNKEINEECKQCFARMCCHGCLGLNHLETGNSFLLSEMTCEMTRMMTERVVVNLYRCSKAGNDADRNSVS